MNISFQTAVFLFFLYVAVLVAIAYIAQYFWNTYLVDMFTNLRPVPSIVHILALMIVISILFGHYL
jgi:hypothetical protein